MKRERREFSGDPSPPYKYQRELQVVIETLAQEIIDTPGISYGQASDLARDFFYQARSATTPEQVHAIASPYLLAPEEAAARRAQSFSSSSSSSSFSRPPPDITPMSSRPTTFLDEDFIEEQTPSSFLVEEDSDDFFTDSPTETMLPNTTIQKAHGTGITRDTRTSSLVRRMFTDSDLCYIDMHQTGQDYGPGVYDKEIFPSFVSPVKEGYSPTKRQGNVVVMKRFTMHLQIVLPGRTITELSSGLLNDELRILIVKDSQPNPTPPKVGDVLSVHDSHHTINAFINPATSERFTILYDTSFFMQYTTLWEFTRGGAEKEAKVLPCDVKEVIDIDLCDEPCTFDRNQDNYQTLVDYNIFAMFITARGVKLTHGYLSDVEEAETFIVDWSARLVFQ